MDQSSPRRRLGQAILLYVSTSSIMRVVLLYCVYSTGVVSLGNPPNGIDRTALAEHDHRYRHRHLYHRQLLGTWWTLVTGTRYVLEN